MQGPLNHAEYTIWASKSVHLANYEWRTRHSGADLMDRAGLHGWLYAWAIRTGRVNDPGPVRPNPHSWYVSLAWKEDRDAVKKEARNYWRVKVAEQQ